MKFTRKRIRPKINYSSFISKKTYMQKLFKSKLFKKTFCSKDQKNRKIKMYKKGNEIKKMVKTRKCVGRVSQTKHTSHHDAIYIVVLIESNNRGHTRKVFLVLIYVPQKYFSLWNIFYKADAYDIFVWK